jgi:hypothetical protein
MKLIVVMDDLKIRFVRNILVWYACRTSTVVVLSLVRIRLS